MKIVMSKSLLVFVGSSNVGPYINVMANSVSTYGVDRIVLVNILSTPSGQQVNFVKFVNEILWNTVSDLIENKFESQTFQISKDFRAYKDLEQVFGKGHALDKVNYQFLRKDMERMSEIYGTDAIVDISCVPKRWAIDILTACLAAGMSNVMLFELKRPVGGIQSLYHNLDEKDYEHVVLPNWEPLVGNIEFFSARQNRQKLWKVIISIVTSLILVIASQFVQIFFGVSNWFNLILVVAITVIGLVGGIEPIIEAWGGIHFLKLGKKLKVP